MYRRMMMPTKIMTVMIADMTVTAITHPGTSLFDGF